MRYFLVCICVLLVSKSLHAQSVSVDGVSRATVCIGDTVWVTYTANGSFKPDNYFSAQVSDGNGSFGSFVSVGHATAMHDSIAIVITGVADHFRVRVLATDPYVLSSNTSADIQGVAYPNPDPSPNNHVDYYGAQGFPGDSIRFRDLATEPQGSHVKWYFWQDADVSTSTDPTPTVTYPTPGVKTGSLEVQNAVGCSSTVGFVTRILTCKPVIPDTVHIVTGSETGEYPYVWVRAGGNYIQTGQLSNTTVYVEPGGSLRSEWKSTGLYYLKAGSSYVSSNGFGYATVVLNRGMQISWANTNSVDTLYCDDLEFDYSQVEHRNVPLSTETPKILFSNNILQATNVGKEVAIEIVNLLGSKVISRSERDDVTIDLSGQESGLYFAIVRSVGFREVRKLVVTH